MNIFGNNDEYRKRVDASCKRAEEFKLYVEGRMNEPGYADAFTGYSDTKVLSLLEAEFSMFKNASPNKKGKSEAKKSKIPSYESIAAALKSGSYGLKFTTPQSDRIYVITRGTWGDKSDNKVVKGFSTDSDMSQIDKYSKRTKVKHGGGDESGLPDDWKTPSMQKGKFKFGKK